MILAEGGKSGYTIVSGADPAQRHAAAELARYMERISGAKLAVAESAAGPKIVIEIKPEGLKNDGYRLHTEGEDLHNKMVPVLIKSKKNGALLGEIAN